MNRRWSALVLVGTLACARNRPPPVVPVPVIPPEEVAVSVYLIGDAGKPDSTGEPVLMALRRDLATRHSERVVVFLGDNAYPRGLPAPGQPGRGEAERYLAAQVEAVTSTGARGYLVPGNHDWAKHGVDGWEAIKRQERFVDSVGAGRVLLRPGGGCPGPSVVDIGARLRLILLDTQWWLHPGPKPRDPDSSCGPDAEQEIVDSLGAALTGAGGRLVVMAQHHPLRSGGEHGGYFELRDHLFPLTAAKPSLWIPLPWIGSLYPAARQQGISSQDIPSRAYQRLIAAFRRAMAASPPALYAAGHEHNLQVMSGGPARVELVSGAGIYGHSGKAVPVRGTLFARGASGFARLDVPKAGPSRLAVLEVDAQGGSSEAFSTEVE
ncbi:MAG: metallophosphoesterase family protein [Gemmatimonadales bacterium]